MNVVRSIYLVAANDFRLTLKTRSILIYVFGLPVVFMLFFGATFKEHSGAPKAALGVENRDGGFLSKSLIAELGKEPLSLTDTLGADNPPPRTLVIPEGFTEKVLDRRRVVLVLRSGANANLEAREAVSAAIVRCLMRVVSRLVVIESGVIASGTKGFEVRGDSLSGSLFDLARETPGLLDSIRVELDSLRAAPALVTVDASIAGTARKVPAGFQTSVPGNLVMFVLMTMVFSGIVITVERTDGVLRRFAYSPAGTGSVLLGKLFGRMGIAIVQIVFLLAVGRLLFRVSLGGSPGALALLMIVFAFCTGAFGMLFGALFRNPDQVSAVSVITTLVMSALGGCWWSTELVSRPFKIISFLFPTGWAMDGLHKLISFGYGMREVALNVAVLALFGAAFMFIAAKKLRWTR